ncbi:hypothetical protein ASG17_02500 [Brevundimonas sp. Leaf363]|uniref:hypothetical protein n=1 Tax=Brevundimonas sp. Leaf363 TaxID=1736353 RepID=UPI0006F1F6F6|nr:hypothetical protein [Brevundimonas sp. Leaf363]KQS57604.1 hypothetical protein ASG17_02500 [Brevundimonas sp. Leaf363]
MRLTFALAGLAALVATGAQAQSSAPGGGEYGADLTRMITSVAGGACPDDIMGGQLLTACQTQLAGMQAGLSSLGAVESASLLQSQDATQGRIETYRVRFAGGQEMNWAIGVKVGGKYEAAFTRGD